MVNRDEGNVTRKKRPPADERLRSEPLAASSSGDSTRRERQAFRPVTQSSAPPAPSAPSPFFKTSSGSTTRRGPRYPAWEKPPTAYDFPRLRGREERKRVWALWPPILVAIGVAVILLVLVALPALMGRGGKVAVVSPSASTVASHSIGPSPSPSASPSSVSSASSSPAPQASYKQYKVQSGDTLTKIAKANGLKSWEMLLANPDLTPPYTLRIGSTLNIPQPGQLTPPPASPPAP
jgi:LysM repeat protein